MLFLTLNYNFDLFFSLSLSCVIKTTDCIIGSQLSVVNKIAVTDIPVPNVILVIQFATASFLLGLAHMFGMIKLENINMRTCIGFLPFVACFFALLSSGMWVMKVAPLETFISYSSRRHPLSCRF